MSGIPPRLSPLARPPLCSTKFPWKKQKWHRLRSLDGEVAHAAISSLATAPRDTQVGKLAVAWVVSGSRSRPRLSWPRLSWPRPLRSGLSDKAPATGRRRGCSSRRWECRKKGAQNPMGLGTRSKSPPRHAPFTPTPPPLWHGHLAPQRTPQSPALPSPPALSITWLRKSPCQKPFLRFPIPGLGSAEEQNRNPSCAHKPHRKIIQKSAKEPFGGSAVTSALNQATGTIPPGPGDLCRERREENPRHFAHSRRGSSTRQ